MTLKKAQRLIINLEAAQPDRKTYLGNVVQDGRAAHGEKADPRGWYVQQEGADRLMYLVST